MIPKLQWLNLTKDLFFIREKSSVAWPAPLHPVVMPPETLGCSGRREMEKHTDSLVPPSWREASPTLSSLGRALTKHQHEHKVDGGMQGSIWGAYLVLFLLQSSWLFLSLYKAIDFADYSLSTSHTF